MKESKADLTPNNLTPEPTLTHYCRQPSYVPIACKNAGLVISVKKTSFMVF